MGQNLDFSFITEEQVNNSNILKDYGTKASITDFAILLGGFVSEHTASNGKRTGNWWTLTNNRGDASIINFVGNSSWDVLFNTKVGFRPTIPYSKIKEFVDNIERKNSEIIEAECFLYPQTICSARERNILEKLYQNGNLLKTGKKYTTNSVDNYIYYSSDFIPREFIEYKYNEKKYIRFIANQNINIDEALSDGTKIEEGCPYWIKVEPIKFLVDEQKDEAIIKDIIVAGIKFNNERNYKGNFTTTVAKNYLDTYFSKDIIPSNIYSNNIDNIINVIENVTKSVEEKIKSFKAEEKIEKVLPYINEYKNKAIDKLKELKKEFVDFDIKDKPIEPINNANQNNTNLEEKLENKKTYKVRIKKNQK